MGRTGSRTRRGRSPLRIAVLAVLAACALPKSPPDGVMPAGDWTVRLRHDGRNRRYLVHVPGGGDVTAPRPVVLVLHGAAEDAVENRTWLGLDRVADRFRRFTRPEAAAIAGAPPRPRT